MRKHAPACYKQEKENGGPLAAEDLARHSAQKVYTDSYVGIRNVAMHPIGLEPRVRSARRIRNGKGQMGQLLPCQLWWKEVYNVL